GPQTQSGFPDQNGVPGTAFGGFGVTGTLQDNLQTVPVFSQEIRLSSSIGQKLDWLAGLFYTFENASQQTDTILSTEPTTGQVVGEAYRSSFPQRFREYAGFADLTYHFSDRFDVQVGGRESHMTNSNATWTNTGPFVPLFYGGATSPYVLPPFGSSANTF